MGRKLTKKQRLFVEAYTGNATEAARQAGYAHPEVAGCRALKKQHIIDALRESALPSPSTSAPSGDDKVHVNQSSASNHAVEYDDINVDLNDSPRTLTLSQEAKVKVAEQPQAVPAAVNRTYAGQAMEKTEVATKEEVARFLTRVFRGDEKETVVTKEGDCFDVPAKMKDRLKATEQLQKMFGWNIEVHEHNHILHGIGGLDSPSTEEVQQLLEQRRQESEERQRRKEERERRRQQREKGQQAGQPIEDAEIEEI